MLTFDETRKALEAIKHEMRQSDEYVHVVRGDVLKLLDALEQLLKELAEHVPDHKDVARLLRD